MADEAREPLITASLALSETNIKLHSNDYGSISSRDPEEPPEQHTVLDRSIENEVIPEMAVSGRNLGWSSAYILIISRVIGSGIFATPGVIVRSVGSVGITLVLWVVGAIFAWFGLAIVLEYGCMLPRSGGDKVYLEFTYRRPRFLAATLIAVQSVCMGFTASNCIVFAEYVLFAFGKDDVNHAHRTILAVSLLSTVIIIHSCFLKAGIFIQNCLGWIKIGLVLIMVVTGVFVVFIRPTGGEQGSLISTASSLKRTGLWEGSNWNWGILSTAFFKVWYSYNGLQNVNNVLNEVKNPVRTLKTAATAALFTSMVLYLLINVSYFIVIPMDEIANSGELVAALFFAKVFGEQAGRILLPIAVALSAAGNVMVVTFSHARMVQEIARQGVFPFGPLRPLVSSSKPFHAPMGALLVHFIPSLIVICLPSKDLYSFILDIEGYPAQIFALASSFGILWLRVKRTDLRRPYKAWKSVVWIRIVMSAALLVAPFVPRKGMSFGEQLADVSYAFVGLSIMCLALLYWLVWSILLPRWHGYRIEEEAAILDDGTTITKYRHVPERFDTTR